MMQIDELHQKNTWDDVRTPPRKIRFLLKIHTAGMDFSTPTNIVIPVLMMQIDEFHRKTLGMMSEHHLEKFDFY
ncbi:hypothetical protein PAPYR_9838 [Paratrimastix pyriformis]|uniref:Uncharacterized protein n=1 Tax=Paratrimastix pyriformis TaxID=342808 RepID=A0ABQ8U7B9_9EUKA|nr:hypothetical protein PAPYR_9838 [Paratrimastix pyriformis]